MPGDTSLVFNLLATDKISGVLDKVKDKFGMFGKVVGLAGAVAGGAFMASIGTAMLDNQALNSSLQAKLGATPQQAAQYGKIAGDLYSQNFGDSMEGVNEAIGSVVQNIDGMGNSPALADVTGKVLNLSKTFGQDLGGTTEAISQMLRTGLAGSAEEALDILTVGFQHGDDKAGDLLDTMTEYGTQFRKLGLDGKTALGLIDQGIKAGARDGDTVADALKEFSIRAIDGSNTTIAGYKAIGLNADQMAEKIAAGGPTAAAGLSQVLNGLKAIEDPAKREAAAVGLFGTKAEDLGQALFALDPATAVSAIGQVGGAADKMGESLSGNAKNNLAVFWRSLQTNVVEFVSGKVLPTITNVTGYVANNFGPAWEKAADFIGGQVVPALKDAGEWLQKYSGWIMPIAVGVGVMVGAWALYKGTMSVVTTVTKAYTAVQTALNAVMAVNPIVLVVIALAGLAAGLIYAYKHSETFRDIINGVFDKVKSAGLAVAHFFTDDIPAAFNTVVGFFAQWGPLILVALLPFIGIPLLIWQHWGEIVGFLSGIWDTVWGFLSTWGPVALAVLLPFIGIPLLIWQHFGEIVGFLGSVWSSALGGVQGFVGNVISTIAGLPGQILAFGQNIFDAGSGLITKLFEGVKSAFSSVGGAVADIAGDVARGIKNGLNTMLHLPLHVPGFDTHIPGVGKIGDFDLIPRLARGGLATGPMLAMVGDNPSGKELVMPMDSPASVALLASAMGKAAGNRGVSGQQFAAASGATVVHEHRIVIEGTGILDGLRKEVRIRAGGNVQLALGT